jgi:hypothetical protein
MHQQLWGYKVEEKLYLGVYEQKRLNTTAVDLVLNTTEGSRHVIIDIELYRVFPHSIDAVQC